MTPGKERTHWRYLHNFIWTVDGVKRFPLLDTLSSSQMTAFGLRSIFLSPGGNGFLVTGNPYANGRKLLLSGRPDYKNKTPLFVFCNPKGKPLVEVLLSDEFNPKELRKGPCPNCDCKDILYVFRKNPALSANHCFVELLTHENRSVTFCLPLGAPVKDREALEDHLAALEWQRLSSVRKEETRSELQELRACLISTNADKRAKAETSIVKMGFLALPLVKSLGRKASNAVDKNRYQSIERLLRPWSALGYEQMSRDLELLLNLLKYPEPLIAKAAQVRLSELLPDTAHKNYRSWITRHSEQLKWDETQSRYFLGNSHSKKD